MRKLDEETATRCTAWPATNLADIRIRAYLRNPGLPRQWLILKGAEIMLNNTIQHLALVEFEQASDAASDLARRIGRCGRTGASSSEMVVLLKAWQAARSEARSSHERLLSNTRTNYGRGRSHSPYPIR
jgi:hypothetical protein